VRRIRAGINCTCGRPNCHSCKETARFIRAFDERHAAEPEPRTLESLSARIIDAFAPASWWDDDAGQHVTSGRQAASLRARRAQQRRRKEAA
jgi:hypothetical protein